MVLREFLLFFCFSFFVFPFFSSFHLLPMEVKAVEVCVCESERENGKGRNIWYF